ncbi:glutamine--tRNA ligase/YqeY domain fusion protein [Psychrobacter sp. FDAARGOS_221]|uniref:glutamine--tRNA ligase/YqeY domain fusion protein n=1 Tax=Psychrobacter sp. FDAARGOS_221 TaxID=1975705 RepID=UPI000BB58959|nr:glutamine--tRNA ligase/YqeY domain fusion protein [Psychrobacter sp. FDAARGOS_221]PNK61581.1 glutamine--tRNA ligase/YqeY domain fusion protein [Psychrobacter sp. FDAARGOS_221]
MSNENNKASASHNEEQKNDFIRHIIREDLAQDKYQQIVTRFPPEPNGYLHLGHVKSICLNFGISEEFDGICNLRFDDTNPTAEKQDYIDNIKNDVEWLGFKWANQPYYASGYFDQLYKWAIQLIEQGDAYVDLQTPEQIKENRGSFNEPGKPSPQRDASVEENLQRFDDMKNGKYEEGEAVLRAKIDMASPNMNMRDPVIYRVMKQSHHQTGDKWCIYPMYDYAHPLSDAIEGITHSLCTLEFEDHRPFYDWAVEKIGFDLPPHQYEFSRLNVDYTMTSKRKLKQLVDEGIVSGWDDPRMPTIAGMRRRGYTPEGLRDFCDRVGVTKADSVVDYRLLEFSIRQSLENTTARGMAVLKPLKVTITNFEEAVSEWESLKADSVNARWDEDNQTLWLNQPKHPNIDMGEREIPFTKTIYIDQADYELEPPKGYKRLSPEKTEIRLRNTYVLAVTEHVLDDAGNVVELKATIDKTTLGKNPEDRKVKGVIHWVSASQGVPTKVRLYEHLFNVENPGAAADIHDVLNPNSLTELDAVVEPSIANAEAGSRFQFEREGYFVADAKEHSSDKPVFNQIVSLRDNYKPE